MRNDSYCANLYAANFSSISLEFYLNLCSDKLACNCFNTMYVTSFQFIIVILITGVTIFCRNIAKNGKNTKSVEHLITNMIKKYFFLGVCHHIQF
jgi:hypothetical protein